MHIPYSGYGYHQISTKPEFVIAESLVISGKSFNRAVATMEASNASRLKVCGLCQQEFVLTLHSDA